MDIITICKDTLPNYEEKVSGPRLERIISLLPFHFVWFWGSRMMSS